MKKIKKNFFSTLPTSGFEVNSVSETAFSFSFHFSVFSMWRGGCKLLTKYHVLKGELEIMSTFAPKKIRNFFPFLLLIVVFSFNFSEGGRKNSKQQKNLWRVSSGALVTTKILNPLEHCVCIQIIVRDRKLRFVTFILFHGLSFHKIYRRQRIQFVIVSSQCRVW